MSRDQPEASTSTASPNHPPPRNLVSLVVDSTLSRDQYLKLIETNGVVHSLIQRLMEKHGGETHLLFNSRVIPIKAKNEPINPNIRAANAQGLRRFSAFLPTLPSLASCLTAATENEIPWPSFTGDSAEPSNRISLESAKIKQRERETCLLNGVVEGLELLSQPHDEAPSRQFLQSLSPPEAASLFSTIHDDQSGSRYIIILTGTPATQAALDARQTAMDIWEAVATTNWDPVWDGKSWRDVGTTSREKGISASCIIAGGEDSDSEISRNLRKLCQETSPNGFEDPWFDVPQDVDVAISGFGLDPGNVPSSPTAGGSSAPTEQIITPAAANIMEPTLNNSNAANAAKVQLMQTQAVAIRALAARASANGNPITQQTMFQLMQAVKAGTLDNNSPGLQQIKTLLALQQQQKQGQASMNPAAANAANAVSGGQSQGQGADQVILAAMHQQMLQQNQSNGNNANGNGANASLPATQQRPNVPAPQTQQQQAQVAPPAKTPQRPGISRERSQSQSQSQTRVRPNTPLWSGDIIWHNGTAARFTVSIDAVPIGENAALEYHTQFWPKELVINQIRGYELGELQNLSKENRAPFVVFMPRNPPSGPDANNTSRYNTMANALARQSNMATINITQDRGLAIFAPQQTGPEGEPRPPRLMGLVCMNCPLPLGKAANTTNGNAAVPRTTPSQGNAMLAPTPTSKIPTPIQTISPSYTQQQQQLQRQGAQQQQQQPQQQQQQQPQPQQQYMPNAGQQLTPQQAAQLAAAAQQRQQLQQQQLSVQQHQQQQQQLQQQQTQQLMQFQQQPSGQPQMMLTPEQDREFRALARVSNLDLGNFDPFNLDETKYRQIMACLATAREREKKQQQMQQQQPQQQMNLGQMGNFPFQQQQTQQQPQQYNNGQNGFGGINMGIQQGFQQ